MRVLCTVWRSAILRVVRVALLWCACASIPATLPVAHAFTITVNSLADTSGNVNICTLRDAITAANTGVAQGACPGAPAGMNTINFNLGRFCQLSPCTISLSSALPCVDKPLTIDGAGYFPTINGNGLYQVFIICQVNVNLLNLRISQGSASKGGGIDIGAFERGATVTLSNVVLSGNHASDSGGAIYGSIYDSLIVTNSTFSGNTAVNDGGAIHSTLVLTVTASTFVGNSATYGGAIASKYWTQLTNVTLSGNSAGTSGGGFYTLAGCNGTTRNFNNVTLTNNRANTDASNIGDGGGIRRDCGTLNVQNSIIAGNSDGDLGTGADCSGSLVSNGYNLIGDADGCSGFTNGINGDKVGTHSSPIDLLLGPLASNGGRTQTHALLGGSPALDAGNTLPPGSGGFACAATDQRGVTRPVGPQCDMGAYEGAVWSLNLPIILR